MLLLTDFDYDADLAALAAFAGLLESRGISYPVRFALRPNAGLATGLDLDVNGQTGEARDAQGYGRFAGQGGLAILSRWPIREAGVTDLSALLWRDLPGATLPVSMGMPFLPPEVEAIQRLSSTGHWIVPVEAPGGTLTVLVWSATPPVFDGPEDLNGLRNRDELGLWTAVLDQIITAPPLGDFVLMGNSNLDPQDGDGFNQAMRNLLSDPRLQDPRPQSAGAALVADPDQTGDPALDTVDWPDGTPGNLRVSYVLPSAGWEIAGAGVFWPAPDDPDAPLLGEDGRAAGPHRLVWAEVRR